MSDSDLELTFTSEEKTTDRIISLQTNYSLRCKVKEAAVKRLQLKLNKFSPAQVSNL